MDVDGVLTDGTIGMDDRGGEQKRFHVADGMGMTALRLAGIEVAWVSGRASQAVTRRGTELGIRFVHQGVRDKRAVVAETAAMLQIDRAAVAFIGDDWNDLAAFEAAGVRIAVAGSAKELLTAAHLTTERRGGHGAVREVCDGILDAKGVKAEILGRYLDSLRAALAGGRSEQ